LGFRCIEVQGLLADKGQPFAIHHVRHSAGPLNTQPRMMRERGFKRLVLRIVTLTLCMIDDSTFRDN
jgi:hypothetical protein